MNANAVVFPGQGAQSVGMGKELFDRYPALISESDEILGYSVRRLCLENPGNRLNQTEYTQVALYVVNALHYYSWKENGNEASWFAGHSLGEYNALLATETFEFATGLRLVKKRGEAMSSVKNGGMMAVLNISASELKYVLDTHGFETVDIANINTQLQTVIAGPSADLERAKSVLERKSLRCVKLNVSGAFHSRYMQPAADIFMPMLRSTKWRKMKHPVVSNLEAAPYSLSTISETLAAQVTSPVRWLNTIEYFLDHGVESITQLGPGNVLQNMTRQIKRHKAK